MRRDTAAKPTNAMSVLAARLRELPRGVQHRVAKLAGLNEASLSRWRKAEGNPRLNEVEALARALGVTIGYLVIDGSTEKPTLPTAVDASSNARAERLYRKLERKHRELEALMGEWKELKLPQPPRE